MKLLLVLFLFTTGGGFAQPRKKVIQIDIASLLNARPVTTFTNGKLITWTKGIDGNGQADGFLTQSAALFKGDMKAHALPDNPVIAANHLHPDILLHYSNSDAVHSQARFVSGEGDFFIAVSENNYSDIFLGLSSSEGASRLQCQLQYRDENVTKSFVLPDYYTTIPATDSNFTYVLTDLAKWGPDNTMTEKDHHNIHLLKLSTDAKRRLTGISVKKEKEGYLVFWSATGVFK